MVDENIYKSLEEINLSSGKNENIIFKLLIWYTILVSAAVVYILPNFLILLFVCGFVFHQFFFLFVLLLHCVYILVSYLFVLSTAYLILLLPLLVLVLQTFTF